MDNVNIFYNAMSWNWTSYYVKAMMANKLLQVTSPAILVELFGEGLDLLVPAMQGQYETLSESDKMIAQTGGANFFRLVVAPLLP